MSPASPLPADPAVLAHRLLGLTEGGARVLVGICGAPGAGKSTLAARLAAAVNATHPGHAVVVGMDGFHLAASVIAGDERAARRGAPDTFDPAGYAALLARLVERGPETVYAPEFRRPLGDPVAGAVAVPPECPLVITEGNYLLHPAPPWRRVHDLLDEVWFLQAPDEDARVASLIARHVRFGKAPEHAERHVRDSDERNAALIASWRDRADLLLAWPSWDG